MKKAGLIVGGILVVVCGVGVYALRGAMGSKKPEPPKTATVTRGDLLVQVVETGTVDAVKAVEVKSRVAGRVDKLFVDEGSVVEAGQKIAIIDPQETQLRVEQDEAQLRGAESGVQRATIEIAQRKVTAKAAVERARLRVAQLEQELKVQPTLTRTSIESSQTTYNSAVQARDQLIGATQPNERTASLSSVREAEANHANAARELERRRGLLQKGYVAQREVDDAQLQLALAETRLQSARDRDSRLSAQQDLERKQAEERVLQARADLERAKANSVQDDVKRKEYEGALQSLREAESGLRDVQALEKTREQSRATVSQLKSVLRDSKRQLGETDIVSPLDGVVTKKLVQEGELVASLSSFSSGTPIVRVEDRTAMLVKLDINEIDVAKLKVGMKARVSVDALPGVDFDGRISKIAPASKTDAANPSSAVVKYEVEVRIEKADERLKSGMSAKCTMDAIRRDKVLTIPIEYLGQEGERYYVALAPEPETPGPASKGEPKRAYVKIGIQTPTSVEIVSGVAEGTKIYRPTFTGPKRKGAQFGPGDDER